MVNIFKSVCIISLLVIVLTICYQNDVFSQKTDGFPLAPKYSSIDLETKKIVSLESIYKKNNLTLLNLWATWCQPCREEIPILEKIYQDLNKYGVDVVGVSIDRRGSESMITSFTNKLNMTYPILFDPNNNFARAFKTIGVPESFLIDKDGQVVYRWRGPIEGNTVNIENFIIAQSPAISAHINSIAQLQNSNSSAMDGKPTETKTINSSPQTSLTYNIGFPLAFVGGLLSFFITVCIASNSKFSSFCNWNKFRRFFLF